MEKQKINIPNLLILFRLFLTLVLGMCLLFVPYTINNNVFVFELGGEYVSWLNVVCLFIFLLASFTDFLDGYLARKYNQVTNFGKFFDPIADKILINTVLIFFAVYNYVPIWVVILFVTRDLLVDGLRMNLSLKDKVLVADWSGKLKTFLQILGISILFVFHPFETNNGTFYYNSLRHLFLLPLYIALSVSLYSGFKYFKENYKEVIE